jgi:hypothetical protein
MPAMLPLLTLESRIKRKLRVHLHKLGFGRTKDGALNISNEGKESIRVLHRMQRSERLRTEAPFINAKYPQLLPYFASGSDIHPTSIRPQLQLVEVNTLESDLFRLASLIWSIPVSRGYGRRLRFLVWDKSNNKLVGLIALCDPVFNLKVRDEMIGWNSAQRKERLVNIMDANILGAIPPYNMILGGKLIACLVRTQEIRDIFARHYHDTRGFISGKKKNASLTMVTTSSALGRSSVYNRLALNGVKYFESIGYTSGWGHFHIPEDIFRDMRIYLKEKGHPYFNNHNFGEGPNWRFRTLRASLEMLGMNANILRHGIVREVFVCKLASNAERILKGENIRPYCKSLLTVKQVAQLALERWILPRVEKRPQFKDWKREHIAALLDANKDGSLSRFWPSEADEIFTAGKSMF